jgi:L-cysteine desulfidase
MNKMFIGFRFKRPVSRVGLGFYIVSLVSTGEQRAVMGDDFEAFIVKNGYASSNAVMGGCNVPSEILEELGFALPQTEVLAVC